MTIAICIYIMVKLQLFINAFGYSRLWLLVRRWENFVYKLVFMKRSSMLIDTNKWHDKHYNASSISIVDQTNVTLKACTKPTHEACHEAKSRWSWIKLIFTLILVGWIYWDLHSFGGTCGNYVIVAFERLVANLTLGANIWMRKHDNTLHFETFKAFFNIQVMDEKPINTLHLETFYGFHQAPSWLRMRNLTTLFILKHFPNFIKPKVSMDEKHDNTFHLEAFAIPDGYHKNFLKV